ncbi:MAG: MGMT family protein [Flammeovirgaceae bacterium]
MDQKNFFQDVYDVVRLIPKGRVTTYGSIANYLGMKRGARMVGWAMNQAFALDDVPAHRVVNRKGELTGRHHFSPPTRMEELLTQEGVSVKNDQVSNFDQLFWDPMIELAL